MKRLVRRWGAAGLALSLLAGAGGCTTNPLGRSGFTAFMSEAEELRIGREEHPKIVKEFGGEYDEPAVRAYVNEIGQRLARISERPNLKFTFTVLNSDVVNAFAIPGGYVYVTTGLMALVNNEAELAGVMGHEIGHVTARHTAERYSQSVLANLGLSAVGIMTGSRAVTQTLGIGVGSLLAGFSRQQESEADSLGVRYLTRAGYDNRAMAGFLGSLQMQSKLEAKLAGKGGGDRFSMFATHPRTSKRIVDAARRARSQAPQAAKPYLGHIEYLTRIDGLHYGGDRENGFVRGRTFIHPELGFRFEVPKGFQLFNGQSQVAAIGPDGARILFDAATKPSSGAMTSYVRDVWAPALRLTRLERIDVNGLEGAAAAARATAQSGTFDLRLVAIRTDAKTIYRFLFITPPAQTSRFVADFERTTFSFHRLDAAEAAAAQPLSVRLKAVEPGETVESLAARMPFEDYQVERFRVLNGMQPGQTLRVGQLVKIVAD